MPLPKKINVADFAKAGCILERPGDRNFYALTAQPNFELLAGVVKIEANFALDIVRTEPAVTSASNVSSLISCVKLAPDIALNESKNMRSITPIIQKINRTLIGKKVGLSHVGDKKSYLGKVVGENSDFHYKNTLDEKAQIYTSSFIVECDKVFPNLVGSIIQVERDQMLLGMVVAHKGLNCAVAPLYGYLISKGFNFYYGRKITERTCLDEFTCELKANSDELFNVFERYRSNLHEHFKNIKYRGSDSALKASQDELAYIIFNSITLKNLITELPKFRFVVDGSSDYRYDNWLVESLINRQGLLKPNMTNNTLTTIDNVSVPIYPQEYQERFIEDKPRQTECEIDISNASDDLQFVRHLLG